MIRDPLPKQTRDKAVQLFRDGLRPFEVANQLELSDSTVRSWYAKWKRDVAKAEMTLAVSTLTEDTEATEEDLSLPEAQQTYDQNFRRAAITLSEHAAKMNASELVQKADKIAKADLVARKALKLDTTKPFPVIQIGILAQPITQRKQPPIADADILELPD